MFELPHSTRILEWDSCHGAGKIYATIACTHVYYGDCCDGVCMCVVL